MAPRGLFKTGMTVAELPLVGEAVFLEKLQGAVDGDVSDLRVDLLHPVQKLFDGQMAARAGEDLQDHIPLLSLSHSLVGEGLLERFKRQRHEDSLTLYD